MRWQGWAVLAMLALGATSQAKAQNANPISSSALTGITPAAIKFTPIDLSAATAPALAPVNAATTNWFSLSGFFRNMPSLSMPTLGSSNIPTPSFSNPVMPLPPINSTVR